MAQEMNLTAFVEGIFGAALAQAIEEERADKGICTDYSGIGYRVYGAVRSACIGASESLLHFSHHTRGEILVHNEERDPELHREAGYGYELGDVKLLWRVGFTPAMEREAYRLVMQEELDHAKCTEKLMVWDDDDSRNSFRQSMYSQCGEFVHYYVKILKQRYMETAEDYADLEGDKTEGRDPFKERLKQRGKLDVSQ